MAGDRGGALPSRVQAEVQRILDAEARRLLADQLDRDSIGATAGSDGDSLDGGADQRTASVKGEPVPILGRVDDDSDPVAA